MTKRKVGLHGESGQITLELSATRSEGLEPPEELIRLDVIDL